MPELIAHHRRQRCESRWKLVFFFAKDAHTCIDGVGIIAKPGAVDNLLKRRFNAS